MKKMVVSSSEAAGTATQEESVPKLVQVRWTKGRMLRMMKLMQLLAQFGFPKATGNEAWPWQLPPTLLGEDHNLLHTYSSQLHTLIHTKRKCGVVQK